MSNVTASLHVDYADQVMGCDCLYDEEKIAHLMETIAQWPIHAVNWRVEAIGGALYPSRMAVTADHFDEHDAQNPPEDWTFPPHYNLDSHRQLSHRMSQILNRFDPIAVAAKYARRNHLQFNLYICPFDQYWPGRTGRVLQKFPYACWTSRDGQYRMTGMVSMAYPEVRDYFKQQYAELKAYDFDSLYVYLGCHGWYGWPHCPEEDFFGYELPVVADFHRRHGLDIRTADHFDRLAWHKLKGEYYTQFLHDLHELFTPAGHRLMVGTMLGDYHIYSRWAQPRQYVARFHADWPQWTRWGGVDLCVGDQSDIWTHSLWQSHPDMLGAPDKMPYEFLDEYYGTPDQRNFRLFVFRALHGAQSQSELDTVCKAWKSFHADGLVLREAAELEFHNAWNVLSTLKNFS